MILLASSLALLGGQGPDDDFAAHVRPVLERHCLECHAGEDPSGDLDLACFRTAEDALASGDWRRVRRMLAEGRMPPAIVAERPTDVEVAQVLAWIERNGAAGPALDSGGDVTLRRLNRFEFQNAVLDLFGIAYPAAELLPADGVGHGFDVVGETLSMPPVLFEQLFEAAEAIAHAALPPAGAAEHPAHRIGASRLDTSEGNRFVERADRVVLSSNSRTTAYLPIELGGEYLVRVQACEQHAGPEPARMDVLVDRDPIRRFDVTAAPDEPATHEVRVRLAPGEHAFAAAFVNDYYRPEAEDPADRDRNLHVSWIEVVGPVDVPRVTPFELLFRPRERPVEEVVAEVARLAWRGRADDADVEALLGLTGADEPDDERLRAALTAILASPRFLFRPEPPPAAGTSRALTPEELATRLAAFLWSSVPDRRLLDAGEALLDPRGLRAEVERMLRDARASRLATAFAAQWLQLSRLEQSSPDPSLFPSFDEDLRTAMRLETELFFEAILREGRRVSELVAADFTFVNERLARHYGFPGVTGSEMRRVPVPSHERDERGGLLGHAGLLTATSNPTRTSPVLRGKWVLEALLATPPLPPPPGVGVLDESAAARAAPLRERLELHRADPGCAACHAPMDGLGFALENYDAVGAWRARDGELPIDAAGTLADGRTVDGPGGLARHLLRDDALLRGLLTHLATFALGRGLVARDRAALDALVLELGPDPVLADVLAGIVALDAFRRRYGETP